MPSAEGSKDHNGTADDHEVEFHDGDGQHRRRIPQDIGGVLVNCVGPDSQGADNHGTATQAEDCSQDELRPRIDL